MSELEVAAVTVVVFLDEIVRSVRESAKEDRRAWRELSRLTAAFSAASMMPVSALGVSRARGALADIEFVATRALCIRMRVFSNASKAVLCCFTALPFAASDFVASVILATIDLRSAANISRNAARSKPSLFLFFFGLGLSSSSSELAPSRS